MSSHHLVCVIGSSNHAKCVTTAHPDDVQAPPVTIDGGNEDAADNSLERETLDEADAYAVAGIPQPTAVAEPVAAHA